MRIKVTQDNIDMYGLDTLTGLSAEVLLEQARIEMESGNEFWVRIPDVIGGDTEAGGDRNVFEHFSEIPEPDGYSHEQQKLDMLYQCSYVRGYDMVNREFWVCTVHAMASKYTVDANSHAPCLAVDPR